jgi:hypothetical protein
MSPEISAFLTESLKDSAQLRKFDAGIERILREAFGKLWFAATPEAVSKVLTPRQQAWEILRDFYESSIVNSGDLFSYLHVVYDHRDFFEQIGAHKTLKAAEELTSLYVQYSELNTADEKGDFWHQTRNQRAPIEKEAEGMNEFAELLIRFAQAHPEEFSEGPVKDWPFVRGEAEENGSL